MVNKKDNKVLVCGDSFFTLDPDFPGLHWSEKLLASTPPTYELHNLSHGGDSNALISLQLMQGLEFKPDFVILSFTTAHRHELDNNKNACPHDFTLESINASRINRYKSTSQLENMTPSQIEMFEQWSTLIISDDFEILKNYFIICHCLTLLEKEKIPYCYSLGGFSYAANPFLIIQNNFIKNYFTETSDKCLKINLWNYIAHKMRPYFHVDDESVQTSFANECRYHLKNAGIV